MFNRVTEFDLSCPWESLLAKANGLTVVHNGVSGTLFAYMDRFGIPVLCHEADAEGRNSDAYREMRSQLGDDFTTTFTEIPESIVEAVGL